jgi:hypothetical protein
MIKTYPVNDELAGIVPMPSRIELDALTADIRDKGLVDPIVLWRGQVVDGRCRQLACIDTDTEIITRSLDWNLTEDEVKGIVKSLNTRRNLTMTQKATTAFKVYLGDNSKKLVETGAEWGVSDRTMKAINYIYKTSPLLIEPLFNGDSVQIQDMRGNWVASNKINSICQFLKRKEEELKLLVSETIEHEWSEDSYIETQAGKDWYKAFVQMHQVKDVHTRKAIAELANFKFETKKES